ncbi:MAG TPA: hypothetical protein PLY70_17185 [Saprospiraceae bacterium]|nr:hypothetical protein [Saprospiraceae bacterium]
MKIVNLQSFIKGWVVGDFVPSLIQTKDFEVAIKNYQAKDREDVHVHKIATEITIVVSGEFVMNGMLLRENDIVLLSPGESADFCCLEAGATVVIKTPSVKGDKFVI